MMCEPDQPPNKSAKGRVERWLSRLKAVESVDSNPESASSATTSVMTARREVLCALAIQLDSLDSVSSREAILLQSSTICYPLISNIVRSSNQVEAAMPLALLHAVIPIMSRQQQKQKQREASAGSSSGDAPPPATEPLKNETMLIQPLLDQLQATDTAAKPVISLAAKLALSHPGAVLPEAITKLSSPVTAQRSNAIALLLAAADLSEEQGGGSTDFRRLLGKVESDRLADSLLSQLVGGPQPQQNSGSSLLTAALAPPPCKTSQQVHLLAFLDLHVTLPRLVTAAAKKTRPPSEPP